MERTGIKPRVLPRHTPLWLPLTYGPPEDFTYFTGTNLDGSSLADTTCYFCPLQITNVTAALALCPAPERA